MTITNNAFALLRNSQNPISPTFLQDDLDKTMRAILLMRIFCAVLKEEPDIQIATVEGPFRQNLAHIAIHLQKLKRLAHTFECKIDTSLIGFYEAMGAYADQFIAVTSGIIAKYAKEDLDREAMKVQLLELKKRAESLEAQADRIIQEMNTVRSQIASEWSHLEADMTAFRYAVSDKKTAFADLQEKKQIMQNHIRKRIGYLIFSTFTHTVGKMQIETVPLVSFGNTLLAVTLDGAGVQFVGVGAVQQRQWADNLQEDHQQLVKVYLDISKHSSALVRGEIIADHTQSLQEACVYAFDTCSQFFSEWHEIAEGISSFSQQTATASPLYLRTCLEIANKKWGEIKLQIDKLLRKAAQLQPQPTQFLTN